MNPGLLNIILWALIGAAALTAGIFWGIRDNKRKEAERMKEAERFSSMTPEVQKLHIWVEYKLNEARFSFVLWVFTSIVIFGLIYWLL